MVRCSGEFPGFGYKQAVVLAGSASSFSCILVIILVVVLSGRILMSGCIVKADDQ